MSGITLAGNLAISIAIILFLVLKFKSTCYIYDTGQSVCGDIRPGLHGPVIISSWLSDDGNRLSHRFGIMMGQMLEIPVLRNRKSILKAFLVRRRPGLWDLRRFYLSIVFLM